jgi:hypothetical protein
MTFDQIKYYRTSDLVDWRKLVFFENGGFFERGEFVIFLSMILEEEESQANLEPLQEARVKTLLQGLICSTNNLFDDWEAAVREAKELGIISLQEFELAEKQSHHLQELRKTLKSTISCFRPVAGNRYHGGYCTRDDDNNLLITMSRDYLGQPSFISRQAFFAKFLEAMKTIPLS